MPSGAAKQKQGYTDEELKQTHGDLQCVPRCDKQDVTCLVKIRKEKHHQLVLQTTKEYCSSSPSSKPIFTCHQILSQHGVLKQFPDSEVCQNQELLICLPICVTGDPCGWRNENCSKPFSSLFIWYVCYVSLKSLVTFLNTTDAVDLKKENGHSMVLGNAISHVVFHRAITV